MERRKRRQRRPRRKVWTQKTVDRFKAEAERVERPDPEQPGLWHITQPSGMKSWAVRYRRQADLKPCKLTLHGYVSLAMARKLAHDALDKVANGADPASDKQADRRAAKLLAKHGPTIGSASTIDQGFEHYLTKVNRKKGWREATRYEIGRHLGYKCNAEGQWTKTGNGVIDRWTGRPLASITRADIRAVVNDLAEQAPIGANRLLANLKAAFRWMVSEDLLAVSPAAGVDKPGAETKRERKLSDPELVALWHAATTMAYPMGDMIRLLILTGCRRDEVREATWDEFALKERLWRIPKSRMKSGKDHVIPLSDAMVTLIDGLPRKSPKFLFTVSGAKPFSDFVRDKKHLHDAMAHELGALPQWQLHDIRRTVATGMQKLGIDEQTYEACLAHSRKGVTGRYAQHDFAEEKAVAFTRWAAHVAALVEGKTTDNVLTMRRG